MKRKNILVLGASVLGLALLVGKYVNNGDSGSMAKNTEGDQINISTDSTNQKVESRKNKENKSLKDLKKLTRDSLETEVHAALADFWEEDFELPDDFIVQVQKYLKTWGRSRFRFNKANKNKKTFGPAILKELEKNNLPPAFLYLAIHESGLDTSIESKAGARGIWQLMPVVSRHYGLDVPKNWRELPRSQDDRTDPIKSTEAAIKYLKDLDEEFGSFFLAMVAYNAGEGRIRREIKKIEDPMNTKDFWHMYRNDLLPKQTTDYIPKIVATIILSKRLDG